MRAQALPPRAGWRWLTEGYALYRRNPPLMMALAASYWLSLLLLLLVPGVGVLLSYLAMPVLGVGLMNACRDLSWGKPVAPSAAFSGTRQNLRGLLILGGLYFVSVLVALALTMLVDGGELMRQSITPKPDDKLGSEDGLLARLVLMLALLPVMMAWWFAPVLAAWHALPPVKSLFFSLVACWVNWRPFLVYALAVGLYGLLLPAVFLIVVGATAPGAMRLATSVLIIPILIVLVPTLFASFYVCYRDVFGVDERV